MRGGRVSDPDDTDEYIRRTIESYRTRDPSGDAPAVVNVSEPLHPVQFGKVSRHFQQLERASQRAAMARDPRTGCIRFLYLTIILILIVAGGGGVAGAALLATTLPPRPLIVLVPTAALGAAALLAFVTCLSGFFGAKTYSHRAVCASVVPAMLFVALCALLAAVAGTLAVGGTVAAPASDALKALWRYDVQHRGADLCSVQAHFDCSGWASPCSTPTPLPLADGEPTPPPPPAARSECPDCSGSVGVDACGAAFASAWRLPLYAAAAAAAAAAVVAAVVAALSCSLVGRLGVPSVGHGLDVGGRGAIDAESRARLLPGASRMGDPRTTW